MAIVQLKDICKQYEGSAENAVDNFNLTSNEGEFVVLVGPSGCGKTTTMRMIAGLEETTSGQLLIGDRDVSDVPAKDRDIAMVFQSYALYPHMSVRDNMAFSLRLKKKPKDERNKAVEDAASILGIENLLDRKPRALSGGQRQRVALGRAIVRSPQVFLMDEPLSNLDAKLRVEMRAEIIKLHRTLGVTTFYVTHDQVEAMTMGQRIVVMYDGFIQQIATPNALYENPVNLFVATFIGTPSMNLLRARVDDNERNLSGEGFDVTIEAQHASKLRGRAGSDVWLGIRPEHLHQGTSDADHAGNALEGTVEVVEPLGSVTMVQAKVGDYTVTAELDSQTTLSMGDPVTLVCETNRLHAFDIESEKALVADEETAEAAVS